MVGLIYLVFTKHILGQKELGVTQQLQGSLLSGTELKWRVYFTLVKSPKYQMKLTKIFCDKL